MGLWGQEGGSAAASPAFEMLTVERGREGALELWQQGKSFHHDTMAGITSTRKSSMKPCWGLNVNISITGVLVTCLLPPLDGELFESRGLAYIGQC